MSVYKPQKGRFWQYDFWYQGDRFHGSTGQETRRNAEAVERKKRADAALGSMGQVALMTIDAAAGQYWDEKGKRRGDAVDVERRLEVLIGILGKTRKLGDIDQVVVARAIETRRGMTWSKSAKKDAKQHVVSDSTVNRDIVETLRPILRRARSHWTAKGKPHGLPEIDWTELRMQEPRGLSRLYSAPQKAAWVEAAQADDMGLAVDMILTYGLRLGELPFGLDTLSLEDEEQGPTLTLQKGRKKDVILYLPLRQDHARELAARAGRAKAAGLDTVWFREVVKPIGKGQTERVLVALTYSQIEYRISKAANKAGIEGGRRIHGGRHHAASTILRRTRNLKAVQGLLGHASISSTQRYAHVLIGDLREAVEDEVHRNSPGPAKTRARKPKAG